MNALAVKFKLALARNISIKEAGINLKKQAIRTLALIVTHNNKLRNFRKLKEILNEQVGHLFKKYKEALRLDLFGQFPKLMELTENIGNYRNLKCLVELNKVVENKLMKCKEEFQNSIKRIFFKQLDNLPQMIRLACKDQNAFFDNFVGIVKKSCFAIVRESLFSIGVNAKNKVNVRSMSDTTSMYKFDESDFCLAIYRLVNSFVFFVDNYLFYLTMSK